MCSTRSINAFIRKLKQCTNLILHDENYTSLSSLSTRPLNKEGGRGGEGAYFKFRPIGGALIQRAAYSRGGGGGGVKRR